MARGNIFEQTVEYFLEPIREFMEDPSVSEVLINNEREIYVERGGKLVKTEILSRNGGELNLRYGRKTQTHSTKPGQRITFTP